MDRTIACPACGSANDAVRKFCGECGSALSVVCPSCGTPNAPAVKFCGECGARLVLRAAPVPAAEEAPPPPAAERRLVSVLFVDLVGFTTASEGRDAEDGASCSPATSTSPGRPSSATAARWRSSSATP